MARDASDLTAKEDRRVIKGGAMKDYLLYHTDGYSTVERERRRTGEGEDAG
jgi:hypothetical protein